MQAKLKAGARSATSRVVSRVGQAALSAAKDMVSGRAADEFNNLYGMPYATYRGRGQFDDSRLGIPLGKRRRKFTPRVGAGNDEHGLDPLQQQQRAMYGG